MKNKIYITIFTVCLGILFSWGILCAQPLPPLEKYTGPIKPGITITKENWDHFLPELKKLLPPSKIKWLEPGVKKGIITMPIVEYKPVRSMNQGYYEATLKNEGKAKIDPQTHELLNWEGGLPFPDPKNAWELFWNSYNDLKPEDDSHIESKLYLFHKDKYEKSFSWNIIERFYKNRVFMRPLGNMDDYTKLGINFKSTTIITEPHDVRGFISLRKKYWDLRKPDESYAYIPALKRIRRLTGSDVTDPLLGSDIITDDFAVSQQKVTLKMEVRLIGHREMLTNWYYVGWLEENPNLKPKYIKDKHGPWVQVEWVILPQWILEIKINDPDYVYSKRVIYVDAIPFEKGEKPSLPRKNWGEQYDQAGRLWRANGELAAGVNPLGFHMMLSWIFMDCLKDHYSVIDTAETSYLSRKRFETYFPLKEDECFTIKGVLGKMR